MVKVVSFDMDGTLIRKDYVEHVWLEAIPELYARKNGMEIEDAKEYVMNEYLKVGEAAIEWYDIKYWLKKFEIDCDWRELLESHAYMLKLYPEVNEVLENLRGEHKLIIISNAAHEFIEVESRVLGLNKKFKHIFSAVTDFGNTKKSSDIYQKICGILGIENEEMVHVGDNYEFDYVAPSKAGIRAFYLDRDGSMGSNGENVVKNLKEFEERVKLLKNK